jgi:hypothetical protein
MSRSNHSYYEPFRHTDEQRPLKRAFATRRGVVYRRKRIQPWSKQYWRDGPPHWWKQMWHQIARAVQKEEMLANPDDPVITPERRIIDLWDWY